MKYYVYSLSICLLIHFSASTSLYAAQQIATDESKQTQKKESFFMCYPKTCVAFVFAASVIGGLKIAAHYHDKASAQNQGIVGLLNAWIGTKRLFQLAIATGTFIGAFWQNSAQITHIYIAGGAGFINGLVIGVGGSWIYYKLKNRSVSTISDNNVSQPKNA